MRKNKIMIFLVLILVLSFGQFSRSEQGEINEDLLMFFDIFMGFPEEPPLKGINEIDISANELEEPYSNLKLADEASNFFKKEFSKISIKDKSKVTLYVKVDLEKTEEAGYYCSVKMELSYYDKIVFWTEPVSRRAAKIVLWEDEDGFLTKDETVKDDIKKALEELIRKFAKEWHKDN